MKEKCKTNKVTCAECKYGVDVNVNGRVKLCDPPRGHKMHKKTLQKHGLRFSCGYGVMWNEVGN